MFQVGQTALCARSFSNVVTRGGGVKELGYPQDRQGLGHGACSMCRFKTTSLHHKPASISAKVTLFSMDSVGLSYGWVGEALG